MALDGVNGNNGFNLQQKAGAATDGPKEIGKLKQGESLFTVHKEINGTQTDLIYKDFNGDGVITENELYLIDKFQKEADGTTTVKRYKDKDGDGFSDGGTTYKFDSSGKMIDKQEFKEKDISVAQKEDDAERAEIRARIERGEEVPIGSISRVESRRMENLKEGMLPDLLLRVDVPQNEETDPLTQTLKDNGSVLGDAFSDGASLEAMGFAEAPYGDLNGGKYYKKDGATVRVQAHCVGDPNASSNTYQTDKISHYVRYENGKPTGGVLQEKQDDGTIKVTKYTVDENGKKTVTEESIRTEKYFAQYE